MPRKKTVIPDEPPMEALTAAETGAEENAGQLPEAAGFPDAASSGETAEAGLPADGEEADDSLPSDVPAGEVPSGEDVPGEGNMPSAEVLPAGEDVSASAEAPAGPLPGDGPWGNAFPAGAETPFPEMDAAAGAPQPQEGMELEGDDPEYGALLQELGEAGQREAGGEDPLTLDPPPGEEPAPVPPAAPAEMEGGMDGEEPAPPRRPRGRPRRTESAAAPAADPRRDRVLTIEVRDEVQTAEEREAIIWHEIQNAHWTRRILTGTLDGVERTESGLTVAVVNYKGFRVAIPVKEMLLFTGRVPSGAEFQELMSRMRGILTARLGSEIDFIVKGHENKSRSVAASRKGAMYRKCQSF